MQRMDEMEIGPVNSFDSKMHGYKMEDLTINCLLEFWWGE